MDLREDTVAQISVRDSSHAMRIQTFTRNAAFLKHQIKVAYAIEHMPDEFMCEIRGRKNAARTRKNAVRRIQ